MGLTQEEVEAGRVIECVDHTDSTVDARIRWLRLLPAAPTPSCTRAESAGAVAGGSGAGPGAEDVSSERRARAPANWPARGVQYASRCVYASPDSDEEKMRRLMEQRTPLPRVEIFLLPPAHPVVLHMQWGGTEPPRGLRATAEFAPDEVIGTYTGHVRHISDRDNESPYSMLVPAGLDARAAQQRGETGYAVVAVDAAVCGNEIRFVNDSRHGVAATPNAAFEPRLLRSDGGATAEVVMALVARLPIQPGVEITASYGPGYWESQE